MSPEKLTFVQRTRVLECAAETIKEQIEYISDPHCQSLLKEMVDAVFTEVEAMKAANRRFRDKNATRRKAKTTPERVAITN